VFGTAAIALLAQTIEYRGLAYMNVAGALALATVVGTVVSVALAVGIFKDGDPLDVVLGSCCIAGLPFLVSWLLTMNGTQLNVHGYAIFGYFVYLFGSEVCAIGLLIAVPVRAIVRSKRRRSV
jgi:hypothetical protein